MISDRMMTDGGGDPSLNININSFTHEFTNTLFSTIKITCPVIVGAGSYSVKRYSLDTQSPVLIETTNSNTNEVVISGLVKGKTYRFDVFAYSLPNAGGVRGTGASRDIVVPLDKAASSQEDVELSSSSNPRLDNQAQGNTSVVNKTVTQGAQSVPIVPDSNDTYTRSLYVINNLEKDKSKYKVVTKSFDKINITTPTTQIPKYYSFGTSIFLDDKFENVAQTGGFGFFVSNGATDGYFIRVSTSATARAANSARDIVIMKIQNDSVRILDDTQDSQASTLAGVYGGKIYKIDVKVKCTDLANEIDVYVNGFRITAKDIKDDSGANQFDGKPSKLVVPSKRMAMFSQVGKVSFDYLYGVEIDAKSYENKTSLMNVYNGQFSKNLIDFSVGANLFNENSIDTDKGSIEEFGPIARELRNVKFRYDSAPGVGLYASLGINKAAAIVDSKLSNFGGEIFVLNNSGTFMPLQDGSDYSFFVIGPAITKVGDFKYETEIESEYTVTDPIVFESNWIQKQDEAAALEKWIREIWSKKQTVVQMSVYGNPLVTVGDVIKIKYAYQNLTDSKKFIITNIENSYSQGLETNIICRSL